MEVDLIIPKGEELIPIEIKSSYTFNLEFEKNLDKFLKLSNSPKGYVIYSGDLEKGEARVEHYNFSSVGKMLASN